ncbi:hypothetical protein A2645_01810 [Candidatus Nomurabacteria bacterium RIFCSPHIGHO2_01_FULL_39_9]|uniref:IPT/TIG domain-containing protein n=1 Tax=Candidatus Nomurabacteria bacterium RIFCSPHIGHO2_01_FULL_39_9 TaxID=1801735 RepID=A0A1F6UVB8_9BACT|nr:MAG: hypothetical protein A2645_01810 [Candidatus Nomurabacteria bacterium RIFCSPHIGHO2_01_FULL_39_9]
MKTPLHITSINHTHKDKGDGGFIIYIYGPSFSPLSEGAKAFWIEENKETVLETEYVSQTELKSAIPAPLLAKSGVFGIKVKDGDKESNVLEFYVGTPVPTITKVIPGKKTMNPNQTKTMTIYVNGTHFLPDAVILAEGEPVKAVRMNSRAVVAELPAEYIKKAQKITITAFNPGTEADESNLMTVEIFDPAAIREEEPNGNQNQNQNIGANKFMNWLNKHWFSTLILALILFLIGLVCRECSGDKKEAPKEEAKKSKTEVKKADTERYLTPEKGIIDLSILEPGEKGILWLDTAGYTIIESIENGKPIKWWGFEIEPNSKVLRKFSSPSGVVVDTIVTSADIQLGANARFYFKGVGGNDDGHVDFIIRRCPCED